MKKLLVVFMVHTRAEWGKCVSGSFGFLLFYWLGWLEVDFLLKFSVKL
jgi:hypothetical protein